MYCDAHCHPCDLLDFMEESELESMLRGTAAAASSWNREQFEYHENLAKKLEDSARVILCFALHPQFPASSEEHGGGAIYDSSVINDAMLLLENLAKDRRVDAVGETGFDLYDENYRSTVKIQDEIFEHHMEIAVRYGLPVVLHVRRAMHKIFARTKTLKKLPAVIFHSWQGTAGEGESLLNRGINAFFSFGASIVNGHNKALSSCARLPPDRILFETDAPYIPPRGKTFSSWIDLPLIYKTALDLRSESSPGDALNVSADSVAANFARAFGLDYIL